MHWKWWSKPRLCLRGLHFWGWRGMVLFKQHVLYRRHNSESLLWRGHIDRCYKRERFAVHWRFTVLECTTPGCDLHSHFKVVVAAFPDYSAECPKILQSTLSLYIICAMTVPECLSQVVLYGLAQTLSQTFLTLRSWCRATTLVNR